MQGETNSNAFVILRGCVRIHECSSTGKSQNQMYYKEDLAPGEMIGETSLTGTQTRHIEAQALCAVDLALVDYAEYMRIQGRESTGILNVEQKIDFLKTVPMLRTWDEYSLQKIAAVAVQKEINKGVVLTQGHRSGSFLAPPDDPFGAVSHSGPHSNHHHCGLVCIIINGKVDVVGSLKERHNLIASLTRCDFVNESEIINVFAKDANDKVAEIYCSIAVTALDVLVIPATEFMNVFTVSQVDHIRYSFLSKQHFRKDKNGDVSPPKNAHRSKLSAHRRTDSSENTNIRPTSSNVRPSSSVASHHSSHHGKANVSSEYSDFSAILTTHPLKIFSDEISNDGAEITKLTLSTARLSGPQTSVHASRKSDSIDSRSNSPHTVRRSFLNAPNSSRQSLTVVTSDLTPYIGPRRGQRGSLPMDYSDSVEMFSITPTAAGDSAKNRESAADQDPIPEKRRSHSKDNFYIHYLLSSPISSPKRRDSVSAKEETAATGESSGHVAASAVGSFPLVSRQAGLRRYVKPLREMHVLPAIVALEEKIGQRHISSILDTTSTTSRQSLPVHSPIVSESLDKNNSSNNNNNNFNINSNNNNDNDNDNNNNSTALVKVSELSVENKSAKSRRRSIRMTDNASLMKLPEEEEEESQSESSSQAGRLILSSPQTRHLLTKSSTLNRSTSQRDITTSHSENRNAKLKMTRFHSSKGPRNSGIYSSRTVNIGSNDDIIPPPTLDAFFKPVVHPDGVFSTPVIKISEMPTAKASINNFLSSLSSNNTMVNKRIEAKKRR